MSIGKRGLGNLPEPSGEMEFRDFLRDAKFDYELQKDERRIAEEIEERAQEHVSKILFEAERAVEDVYDLVKVVVPGGEVTYDWSNLTGQDLETAIFTISKVVGDVEQIVTKEYMRTHFAYTVWDDEYWESYRKPLQGTTGDREAYAKRHTRDARYQYLFQYWFWTIVKSRLDYFKQVQRDFRWAIERRINDRRGVYE